MPQIVSLARARGRARDARRPSTEALVRRALRALAAGDDDPPSAPLRRAVGALRARPARGTFDLAVELCASDTGDERRLGAAILGGLGAPRFHFWIDSVPVVFALMHGDRLPRVRAEAANAWSCLTARRSYTALSRLVHHPEASVRAAVASAVPDARGARRVGDRRRLLIVLAQDVAPCVRAQATTGLAFAGDDHPTVIAALIERADDDDDEVRGEALVGLAFRDEPSVSERMQTYLESSPPHLGVLLAASTLRDPSLYPALVKLRAEYDEDEIGVMHAALDGAIRDCRMLH